METWIDDVSVSAPLVDGTTLLLERGANEPLFGR